MISETKLRRAIRAALIREMKADHSSSQYSVGGAYGEKQRAPVGEPLVSNPILAIEKVFTNLSLFPTFSTAINAASPAELLLLIKIMFGYSPDAANAFDEEAKVTIAELQRQSKEPYRK